LFLLTHTHNLTPQHNNLTHRLNQLPRKSYIPGSWYYELNTADLSTEGGYDLDGPIDRQFLALASETTVQVRLPLNMSDYGRVCPQISSGCFDPVSLLNVQTVYQGLQTDDLLDIKFNTSLVFSSNATFNVSSFVLSVPFLPSPAMNSTTSTGTSAAPSTPALLANQLVRWSRLYTRSVGIDALNVTMQTQVRTCECVGSSVTGYSYTPETDRFFCRPRVVPCPVQPPGDDSVCVAGPSLSACTHQNVTVFAASSLNISEPVVELCSLSTAVDVNVEEGSTLSVLYNLQAAGNLTLSVFGSLNVLDAVEVGTPALPHDAVALSIGPSSETHTIYATEFHFFPACVIYLTDSVFGVAAPSAQEKPPCVSCAPQPLEAPSCVVREKNCTDSTGLLPTPRDGTSDEYWGLCTLCVCQGGPDACSTQQEPFTYGRPWCFIDAASRASGCVGSDGVSHFNVCLSLFLD
jgi:hypothetical protein